MVITTKERLVGELTRAAKLEHAAICQYLFAAHSLKSHPAEPGVTEVQLERIREWQSAILMVARGEMEHLGLVCNLLIGVGAAPAFGHPAFPHEGPNGIHFSLEPFSESTLERFIELEASHDDGGVYDLYTAIRKGFETLAKGEAPLFVGNVENQVSNRSIGLPPGWYDINLTKVTDLESAVAAIDRVLEAGDNSQGDDVVSNRLPTHRERFESVLDDFRELRQSATTDFNPVRPVVSNPTAREPHNTAATQIEHPVTCQAIELFDAVYETMLVMLTRFYSLTDETHKERMYLGKVAFRPIMTVILRPLAEILTRMPVSDALPGRTAGATFEVSIDLHGPVIDKSSAWQSMLERLRDLEDRSQELHRMIAEAPSPWAATLAPRTAFLAENLEAMAISFAHHIEMAEISSTFRKLMES